MIKIVGSIHIQNHIDSLEAWNFAPLINHLAIAKSHLTVSGHRNTHRSSLYYLQAELVRGSDMII